MKARSSNRGLSNLKRDEIRWLRKYRNLPSAKCRRQFRTLVEEVIEVILEEARRPKGPDDDGGIPAPAPRPKLTVVQTSALVPRRSTALKHVAMSRHVPGVIARELLGDRVRGAR